jgi:predicted hydrocarbon binding protein
VGVERLAESAQVTASIDRDGHGRIFVRGSRYLLIRPETLVALQRAVEQAVGSGAAAILAAGGRAGGVRATSTLAGGAETRVRALLAMGAEIGWGEFALERFGPCELVVTVRHSPFAETWGRSATPVCHLTRGVLESLAAAVLAEPLRMVETDCATMGAPACRFATVANVEPAG